MYCIGLLYSFLAIFMVADIFMCSVDCITSTTRTVTVATNDGGAKKIEVPIWNGALANILLLSLGPRYNEVLLLSCSHLSLKVSS